MFFSFARIDFLHPCLFHDKWTILVKSGVQRNSVTQFDGDDDNVCYHIGNGDVDVVGIDDVGDGNDDDDEDDDDHFEASLNFTKTTTTTNAVTAATTKVLKQQRQW